MSEKATKLGKVNTLLDLMQGKAEEFRRSDEDDIAENIERSISFLKGLPSDNDRLAFVEGTPDFVGWMTSNFEGDDEGEKAVKEAFNDKSEDVEYFDRDEKGNRVLSRKELVESLGLKDGEDAIAFDPSLDKSWYQQDVKKLQRNANRLGVSYGTYVHALAEESKKQGREKAVNDGTVDGFVARSLFPRITESAKAGREISPVDVSLDVGDKILYALPISTGLHAVTKAGKVAANVGKAAFAPLVSETADVAAYNAQEAAGGEKNEDRNKFSLKDVITGITANVAFSKLGSGIRSGVSSTINYFKNAAKETNKTLSAKDALKEGLAAYDKYNELLETALKNTGAKEFGSLKNVETFLNADQVATLASLKGQNISENAAVNEVVKGIAKVIADNPKKKWTLNEASNEFFASISPDKRKELYKAIEGTQAEGVRFFHNNEGKWSTFNKKRFIPTATDQFGDYAKSTPLGDIYKRNYRTPIVSDDVMEFAGSEAKNIAGQNKTINERVSPFVINTVEGIYDGFANGDKAVQEFNERKRRHGLWLLQMQQAYKKAMGL